MVQRKGLSQEEPLSLGIRKYKTGADHSALPQMPKFASQKAKHAVPSGGAYSYFTDIISLLIYAIFWYIVECLHESINFFISKF